MGNKWSKIVLLLTMTTVFLGQMPNIALSEGTSNSQVVDANHLTFTYLKGKSSSAYTPNVSSDAPGYVHRFITEPFTLKGVDNSHDFFYNVPKAALGANNYLELSFSHPDLLISTQSTLTVSVDDKPIKSIFLTKETSQQGKIKIPLGTEETTLGYHKLTFSKHSIVSDDLCSDQYNPANWLKIEPRSFVYLDTQTKWESSDLLKDFPYPFVEPGTPIEMYGAIIVPNNPSAGTISSALQVSTFLSAQSAAHGSVPILTEGEWEKKGKLQPTIAIGTVNDWTGKVKKLITDNGIEPKGQDMELDYFSMTDNRMKQSKLLLLVSGENQQVIDEKTKLLTDLQYTKQLTGSHLTIQENQLTTQNQEKPKNLTLATFGYDHLLLDEAYKESNRMTIQIPTYWKISGESTLNLKVKVSPLLMNDTIQQTENQTKDKAKDNRPENGLTVMINGVPTTFALSQLKDAKTADGTYTLSIPLSSYLTEEAENTLNLSFIANITPVGSTCYGERNNGRWIFIDKGSVVNVPHEVSNDLTFKYWPAPFVNDNGVADTAFLLPQDVSNQYLQQLSMVANDLVSNTSNQYRIPVFREPLQEDDKKELEKYNVIAMGDTKQFPSLQQYNDKLLVTSNGSVKDLSSYSIINETTRYVGWIQKSVWNEQRNMAIFQSTDPANNGGSYIHTAVLQYLRTGKDGQIVVMSKSNEVFVVDANKKSTSGVTDSNTGIKGDFPIWVIALLSVVFVSMVIVFIRLRRKERLNNRDDRNS